MPVKSWALSIDDVRFGLHQDKTRLVLDLDAPAGFQAFVLSDPYRMVIDLPSFTWNAGSVHKPRSAGVSAVRHGNLKPGVSRIVFDLNRPVSIQSAFVLPQGSGKPDRLVIDFANVSPSMFQKIKNKVHGDLNVQNTVVPKAQSDARTAGSSVPKPSSKPSKKKPLVIIDPGHGGVDPGAISANGLYEKKIVLALAKQLKKRLEDSGQYRVHLTRSDDRFIKLGKRVRIARDKGGDLFISLHADSLKKKNVSGASVYTLSEKASDAQTAKLAARENKADLIAGVDLEVEDKDVANILMDLAMRDTMNQSKFFANSLVSAFNQHGIKTLERPHRYAGFAVLKAPDIPSVLVEAGFLSNKAEAQKLNTSSHRAKIANALKAGVDRYFEQVRKNQRE